MDRNTNFLSELEAEFEAEFESELETDNEYEIDSEQDSEYELESDYEHDAEQESDYEYDAEQELDHEYELEAESESEFEYNEGNGRSYESRLHQLLSRSGDNELEFDQELNQVIYEMEQEFFFKGLKKLAKKGLRKFKSIAGRTPLGKIISTASSLARGNIRDALRKAAGLALRHGAGFIPGGAMLGSAAARALNMEVGMNQETPAKKARHLVQLAQKSYQNLAQQIDPMMADPRAANAMAKRALQKALTGMNQGSKSSQRGNHVVVQISQASLRKLNNGGSLIIKVRRR